jgi:hypothetical protein
VNANCKRCGGPDDHSHDLTDCCARLIVRAREAERERDWFAGWLLRHKYSLPQGHRDEALRRAETALQARRQ